jgi:hypothetical protein
VPLAPTAGATFAGEHAVRVRQRGAPTARAAAAAMS